MPGAFHGIGMASHALRNFQRALDTAGHNIANVNTRGYSRQVVEFSPNEPVAFWNRGFNPLGSGASISSISRIRDGYLDQSMNQTASRQGQFGAAVQGLDRLERMYGEPSDTGIAARLGKFFDSWSALGSKPGDPAARAQMRMAGQQLADSVRGAYGETVRQESEANNQAQLTIQRINQLAGSVAELNRNIRQASASGGRPNDLLDQRDNAVAELSKLVNVNVERWEDGSYAVYAAGVSLVDSAGARTFPSSYDAAAGTVTDGTLTYNVRSGALAGHFKTLQAIDRQQANLDQLANTLRAEINSAHRGGTTTGGATGINFFNDVPIGDPPTGAIDFDLSADIKSSVDNIVTSITGKPGDGGLALALSRLRDTNLASLGNRSFQRFHQDNVAALAGEVSYFQGAAETESAVADQIKSQIQAVSGVSIDDEMADMMRLQRSYQAAARALTVFDQVAEDLIGMLRR